LSDTALAALLEHVVETGFEDLPAAAIAAAKIFVLDTLANGVAGVAGADSKAIISAAKNWGADPVVPVWGHSQRLPPSGAALVNAYQVHCLEYDCVHEGAVCHPMTPLLPALLADAAARGGVSGRDLLLSVVLGVDITCQVGAAATAVSPFFRTGTVTSLGTAAACGKLRGFDQEQLIAALGIAFEQIGASRQAHTEGTRMMGLLAGFAARAALIGCDLAAAGVRGPRELLTGPYGYLSLYELEFDEDLLLTGLASPHRILELAQKPYPSGRPTHICIEAAQSLLGEHDVTPEKIDRLVCHVPEGVAELVGRPVMEHADANYAKLCIGYCVATAFYTGSLTVADFSTDALARADVYELARRVEVCVDPDLPGNAIAPATLVATLRDGSEVSVTVTAATGHPTKPMTNQQRLEKFNLCWDLAGENVHIRNGERLIGLVENLETLDDVSQLAELAAA
jgi:aconitate decarboxylase